MHNTIDRADGYVQAVIFIGEKTFILQRGSRRKTAPLSAPRFSCRFQCEAADQGDDEHAGRKEDICGLEAHGRIHAACNCGENHDGTLLCEIEAQQIHGSGEPYIKNTGDIFHDGYQHEGHLEGRNQTEEGKHNRRGEISAARDAHKGQETEEQKGW